MLRKIMLTALLALIPVTGFCGTTVTLKVCVMIPERIEIDKDRGDGHCEQRNDSKCVDIERQTRNNELVMVKTVLPK